MTDLPTGWEWAQLGEIADVVGGVTKNSAQNPAGLVEVPYLRVANVQRGRLDLANVSTIMVAPHKAKALELQVGDVLLNEGGDRDKLGRGWVWAGEVPGCIHQNHVFRARIRGAVLHPKLLAWYANEVARQWFDDNATQSVNLASISLSRIKSLPVPVPPREHQAKLLEFLDDHLSRLDAADQAFRDGLERQKSLVKRVIVDAVPVPGPGHWRLTTVGEAGKVDLGRQRHPDWHQGPNMRPYLRVANVFEDMIDVSSLMEMDFAPEIWERFRLNPSDILLNEGQSPEYLGRPAMYKGFPPDVAFTNSLIRFRAYEDVLPEWALLVFRRHMHAGRFMSEHRITTNIAHLSAGRFKSVEFPIPPFEEQQEIVKVVDEHLTKLAHVRAATQNARSRVADLRRSMLERAFGGRLVRQDEHCEPASALLAQIAGDQAGKPRQRRPAKAAPQHSDAAGTFVQEEIPL